MPNECFDIDTLNHEDLDFKISRSICQDILKIKDDFKGYKIYYIFRNKKEQLYYVKLNKTYSYFCLKISYDYQIVNEDFVIIDL